MDIREKSHRLPKEFYRGLQSVAFTLCIKGIPAFGEPEIVNKFREILTSVVVEMDCIVPVYCFMPDHQHLIISGTQSTSDLLRTIMSYKQRTGFWMSSNDLPFRWQKDFYDHVIRQQRDLATQVKYILDNPVRKGLAASWREYSFKGSVGCRIEDILTGAI